MARPHKLGLDYFPFDVDFFADEKIAAISGEFGIKGEITAIKLLCAIYRNGYFILWSEPMKYKLLRDLPGVSSELFDQIVNRLVKWGFFDETLFNTVKVLTSRGIQKRYFSIVRRRGKLQKEDYTLVYDDNNIVIDDKNPAATELLTTKTPQSKVKKSKLNNPPYIPPGENNENNFPVSSVKSPQERKEKVARKRKGSDLSFVEPAFQPIMADWLVYKSERGQTYRPLGLQRCYARLLTLSGNDAAKARRIVDFSIANNYSGLFPPHDQDNSANRHPATDYHAQPGQTYEDF